MAFTIGRMMPSQSSDSNGLLLAGGLRTAGIVFGRPAIASASNWMEQAGQAK
jgi:hypothetical protein